MVDIVNDNHPLTGGKTPGAEMGMGGVGADRTPVLPSSIGVERVGTTTQGGPKWQAQTGEVAHGEMGKPTEGDKYEEAVKKQGVANENAPGLKGIEGGKPEAQPEPAPEAVEPTPAPRVDNLKRIEELTQDRWASNRGERAAGSPSRSFESIAKDEMRAAQEGPNALDHMAEARAWGHEWSEIDGMMGQGRDAARAEGYSEQAIDEHEGWKAWDMHNPQPATVEDVRADYAEALLGGRVKGGQDFAEKYTQALERPDLAEKLKGTLPDLHSLTDWAIGLASRNGDFTREAVEGARQVLMGDWVQSGRSLDDIARNGPTRNVFPPHPLGEPVGNVMGEEIGKFFGEMMNGFMPGAGAIANFLQTEVGGEGKTVLEETLNHLSTLHDMLGESPFDRLATIHERLAREGKTRPKDILNDPEYREASQDVAMGFAGSVTGKLPTFKLPKLAKFDTVPNIEDAFYKHAQANVADRIDMTRWMSTLPKEWLDKGTMERVWDDIEKQLVGGFGFHAISEETGDFLKAIKPLLGRVQTLADRLEKKLGAGDLADLNISTLARGPFEGLLPRRLKTGENYFGALDAEGRRIHEGIPGGYEVPPSGKLETNKNYYVLERTYKNSIGERVFSTDDVKATKTTPATVSPRTIEQTEEIYGRKLKYGEELEGMDGKTWTVRRPTTDEISANVKDAEGKPLEFHKNPLSNLVDTTLRLQRVDRNVDILGKLKKELGDASLLHHGDITEIDPTITYKGQEPQWTRLQIPQLEGFWAPRKLAEPINDFYQGPNGTDSLVSGLEKVNRFLIGSMFATPFPHIANVAMHWFVGRGTEWANPAGWRRLFETGSKAIEAVASQNELYTSLMRQGNGLLRGSVEAGNFYDTMMKGVFNEMLRDTETWAPFANRFGWTSNAATASDRAIETVRKFTTDLYSWSRRSLWAANDMMMVQHVLNLEARGLTRQAAIHEAERDIPNYRIPSRVLMDNKLGRATSQFMQSPIFMNFGRYKYGQISAMGNMVQDLVRGTGAFGRKEAAAKAVIMGLMGFVVYPQMDRLWQYVTNNPYSYVHRAGPFSLMDAVYNTTPVEKDITTKMSAFVTPSPTIDLMHKVITNHDDLGREIYNPYASSAGLVSQLSQAAGSEFFPLGLLNSFAKGDGLNAASKVLSIGTIPDETVQYKKEKAKKYRYKSQLHREQNDGLTQFLKGVVGE